MHSVHFIYHLCGRKKEKNNYNPLKVYFTLFFFYFTFCCSGSSFCSSFLLLLFFSFHRRFCIFFINTSSSSSSTTSSEGPGGVAGSGRWSVGWGCPRWRPSGSHLENVKKKNKNKNRNNNKLFRGKKKNLDASVEYRPPTKSFAHYYLLPIECIGLCREEMSSLCTCPPNLNLMRKQQQQAKVLLFAWVSHDQTMRRLH